MLRAHGSAVAIAIATLLLACGDDTATGSAESTTATGGPTTTTTATGGSSTSTGMGTGGDGGGGGSAVATTPYVYVGTSDDQIFVMLLDRETGALAPVGAVEAGDNPSFLAPDPAHQRLFAVNEGSSEVAAFTIDTATGLLTFVNRVDSQGNGPAHVSVDTSGSWVLVANYGSGHVASIGIGGDGALDDTMVSVHDAGDNAHLIKHDPTNGVAYVPCLGSEYVTYFALDEATGVLDPAPSGAELVLPDGSGPRHLDFHPTLPIAYIVNELGDSVVVAERGANGELTELDTLPTLPDSGFDPDDNFCADIHVTPDGNFVYASNRGHNSLAIYAVDSATGLLTVVGHTSTGGEWPRNFTIDPAGEVLLVANQQSDEIVAFRIDASTGLLTELATTPTVGAPAFVGVITQPDR